ncbi:hypothetical protein A2U01_0040333, partial [Trifolium medium]|nr:hypothetical protein [Trifolium medium]
SLVRDAERNSLYKKFFLESFTSYVRGVEISYTPEVIDAVFAFREEEHCSVVQRCKRRYTDEQYAMILRELALPGKD